MGLIFDADALARYEAWRRSASGKTIEKMVEHSLHALLDAKPGERVLDVGCGLGNHLILLNRMGLQISGVDASPLVIEQTRRRLGRGIDFRTGSAEDLPFEDNAFDLAVFIHTLEFLDDPVSALKEGARVARRGIFIGIWNSFSWSCLNHKFQGLFRASPWNRARHYNLWEIKSFLSAALGPVPIQWNCGQSWPAYYGPLGPMLSRSEKMRHWPFGLYLGLYAPLHSRLQTLQTPLRIKIKKAPQSVIDGITREKIRAGMR